MVEKNMDSNTKQIKIKDLPQDVEQKIFARYVEISPEDVKNTPSFCVDGRTGDRKANGEKIGNKPYPQTLGGSLNVVTINWLLQDGKTEYLDEVDSTFKNLETAGYKLGIHTGQHGKFDSGGKCVEASDCGAADNWKEIIKRLISEHSDIWEILSEVGQNNNLEFNKKVWDQLISRIKVLVNTGQVNTIPSGPEIINHALEYDNVAVQHLQEDHKESAAVVNLKPNTTLDVDNNQDEAQAFNLDLWYLMQQVEALKIDQEQAKLLALGLYLATEMVLVEDKRGIRLPVLVNQ